MRTSRNSTTVMTANCALQTNQKSDGICQKIGLILKKLLQFFPWRNSVRIMGFSYHWTSGQKPHCTKSGKRIDCNIFNSVPFVVFGEPASSSTTSTPTSSSFSSQDSVFGFIRYTGIPVPESGSASAELRGNLQHKPAETENKNENERHEDVQRDPVHAGMVSGLKRIKDERSPTETRGNPAPKDRDTASSSHELPNESRAKADPGLGKYSVHTNFPKDPNCDTCLKTQITTASCRRRATVVPKAEPFGDLITADPKIFSEECESRNNHRCAVVVQDLATQFVQSHP